MFPVANGKLLLTEPPISVVRADQKEETGITRKKLLPAEPVRHYLLPGAATELVISGHGEEALMSDQNQDYSGRDAELSENLASAEREFRETFFAICEENRLDPESRQELRRIFLLTVGDAISKGHEEDYERNKDWILARVKEIAVLTTQLTETGRVKQVMLTTAADRVICFWHHECSLRIKVRWVFCTEYMKSVKPIELTNSEGGPEMMES